MSLLLKRLDDTIPYNEKNECKSLQKYLDIFKLNHIATDLTEDMNSQNRKQSAS